MNYIRKTGMSSTGDIIKTPSCIIHAWNFRRYPLLLSHTLNHTEGVLYFTYKYFRPFSISATDLSALFSGSQALLAIWSAFPDIPSHPQYAR